MKQHLHRHFSSTQAQFLNENRQKRVSCNIPLFMKTINFESITKTFPLYRLQRSHLNANLLFVELVSQMSNFNKHLLKYDSNSQKKISMKAYHLYRNLYEQLCDMITLSTTKQSAQSLLFQIKDWFHKQRQKLSQLFNKNKQLPQIKFKNQSKNLQQEQRLYRTITDIKNKRDGERFSTNQKTAYSQYFPPKDKILQYKKQAEQNQILENISLASSQSLIKSDLKEKNIHKSKSALNLGSTRYTRFNNSQRSLNKNQNPSTFKVKKFSSSSSILGNSPAKSLSINSSKLSGNKGFSSTSNFRKARQSFLLVDGMVKKDKIQQIINEPDHPKIKSLFQSKKIYEKLNQVNNINSSKISFILNPKKTQSINRKQFIDIDKQMMKKKLTESRLKTDLKRKLQFRQYFSNHLQSKDNQIDRGHNRVISLTDRVNVKSITKLQAKKVIEQKSNQIQDKLNPEQKRRKQFQDSLLKKNAKQTSLSYLKYLNHLPLHSNDKQNNTLSKIPTQRFRSLTSFRSLSLQKKFNSAQHLAIMTAFEKQTVKKINIEALNAAVKTKLKISQYQASNENFQSRFLSKSAIYKGLAVHQTSQNIENIEFLPLQPKLLSNPFFKVKKSKKSKKKIK